MQIAKNSIEKLSGKKLRVNCHMAWEEWPKIWNMLKEVSSVAHSINRNSAGGWSSGPVWLAWMVSDQSHSMLNETDKWAICWQYVQTVTL